MSLGLDVSDLVIYRHGQPGRPIGPLDFEVEQGSALASSARQEPGRP